ncbi:P-loop NTPase family protein [Mycobacteroides abscessus]|uniref:hypothetical protein n=1 Tax=Mycobacteroides abscessus TaxID=36809 RepID=UPI0009289AC7|nr:hypothetical protein [Mycobacteroides abscessus]SHW96732.1 FtsK/SpoIIIE family protein [Mycobacteroides abscessus subsp. abscessus]SHZ44912.1 DNA segregation ATPase FtsK/SpoIIIE and related proteins [Mycobacteroides abscessus subsp. abscessus]SIB80039.1 FtsK/SpoIIIE family protein [Mycobacteroides abscessus subsp. abscessus]SIE55387.1 FtsK/SpoIIIE family protein [Mycobacteroides abscessus subsp. abscessus]SKI35861.1 DNA segregation ATPase FtsK/SpoIIIE and related proteins [Mycobacteroides a
MSRQQRRALAARRTERREDFLWQRSVKQQDSRLDAIERDQDQAEKEYERLSEKLAVIEVKTRQDIERAVSEITRQATAEERRVLSTPLTRYAGGGHGRPPTWVWHVKASMPAPLARRVGIESRDSGPLLVLRPGGGVAEGDLAPSVIRAELPELAHDAGFVGWSDQVTTLLPELAQRYSVLEKLRNDDWLAGLLESAGITTSSTVAESVQGTYGVVERKVTTTVVPSLSDVRVTRTGLRLVFAHQPGKSAKDWNSKGDALRAGLKAAGLNADNMKVSDGDGGSVVLHLNDRDPFEDVAVQSGDWDDDRFRSLLGIDSNGNQVWITWKGSSGMVVGGVPGSGKTSSMLPCFAAMADHAELHVFDGKAQRDLHPLRHIARTYDRSGDLDAPLETLRNLEKLRVMRGDALYESLKADNFWNMARADRERLGIKPVFVILDEAQTWLTMPSDKEKKVFVAEARELVETLIRKGRSAGIVVVLTTQKPSAASIPTDLRDNAALKLCFKVTTPEMAVTVLGQQPADAPSPTDIPRSAHGRFVMETEGMGIILGQAGYRTSSELELMLSGREPVEDQFAVAARLLGKTEKVPSRPAAPEAVEEPEEAVTPPVRETDESTETTGVEGFSL